MDPSAMKNKPENNTTIETINPIERAEELREGNVNSAKEYANSPDNDISKMAKNYFDNKKPLYDKLSSQSGDIVQAMLKAKPLIINNSSIQVADVVDTMKKSYSKGYLEGADGDVQDHIGPDGVYHPPEEEKQIPQEEKKVDPNTPGIWINGTYYGDELHV